jgi:hypothetical protein
MFAPKWLPNCIIGVENQFFRRFANTPYPGAGHQTLLNDDQIVLRQLLVIPKRLSLGQIQVDPSLPKRLQKLHETVLGTRDVRVTHREGENIHENFKLGLMDATHMGYL